MSLYLSTSYLNESTDDRDNHKSIDGRVYAIEVAVVDKHSALRFHDYINPPVNLDGKGEALTYWGVSAHEVGAPRAKGMRRVFHKIVNALDQPVYGYNLSIHRSSIYYSAYEEDVERPRIRLNKVDWRELGAGASNLDQIPMVNPSLTEVCECLDIPTRHHERHSSIRRAQIYRRLHQRLISEAGEGGQISTTYASMGNTYPTSLKHGFPPPEQIKNSSQSKSDSSTSVGEKHGVLKEEDPKESFENREWESLSASHLMPNEDDLFDDKRFLVVKKRPPFSNKCETDDPLVIFMALVDENGRTILNTSVCPTGIQFFDHGKELSDFSSEEATVRRAPPFKGIAKRLKLRIENREVWVDEPEELEEALVRTCDAIDEEDLASYFEKREWVGVRDQIVCPGDLSVEAIAEQREVTTEKTEKDFSQAVEQARQIARIKKTAYQQ